MRHFYWYGLFVISTILFWNCNREEIIIEGGDISLDFSTDTLRFDTVFTELGSATRFIKIYNREKRRVRIDRISLQNGVGSHFRMNVDGIPGSDIRDVEIAAEDSLYIFCEVTIDPNQPLSISPFVVEGSVLVETGDQSRIVVLEAWGQNANYIPSRFSRGTFSVLSCDLAEVVWNDPKPYVIYGGLFINDCTLTLPPGTKVYVHGGVVRSDDLGVYNDGFIWVLERGRLNVTGTLEEPVVIQGDRLEENFQNEPGQWTGIFIGAESRGSAINHATIKNSRFGVYVDSAATLVARNAQFYNTSSSGVIGVHSIITMENCLVYNNNSNAVQLVYGGDYKFDHCTMASYGVDASALALSNFICYVPDGLGCDLGGSYRLNASFKNSIFFGSRQDEIILDARGGVDRSQFNYLFENCIVRVNKLLEDENFANFFDFCTNCPQKLTTLDKLFVDSSKDDYHLDSLSVAIGLGKPIPNIPTDLEGKIRDTNQPDAGCFEREN